MNLIFASQNHNKVKELKSILPSNLTIQSLSDIGFVEDIAETSLTIEGNSLLKAQTIYDKYKMNCLSDDTGLEVDFLNGEPGVFSARYAGIKATDEQNNSKLIKKMRDIPVEDRKCYFICVLVFMRFSSDPAPLIAKGCWEGLIGNNPVGQNGFGFDPIFIEPQSGKTAAQLSPQTKMSNSHRGKALRNLYKSLALEYQ